MHNSPEGGAPEDLQKAPSFQFYPKDWLSESRIKRMSLAAQGAYMRLLCHMWTDSKDQCSIEKNHTVFRRIFSETDSKTRKILAEIQWPDDPIFIEKNGRLISGRLQKIKAELDRYRRAKSEAGKRGMEARWGDNRTMVSLLTKDNSSTPTSTATAVNPTPKKKRPSKDTLTPKKDMPPPTPTAAPTAHAPAELADLEIYRNDKTLLERWPRLFDNWKRSCPGIDIALEIKQAYSWETSTPRHRKIDHGAFLTNWLNRAQQRASRGGGAPYGAGRLTNRLTGQDREKPEGNEEARRRLEQLKEFSTLPRLRPEGTDQGGQAGLGESPGPEGTPGEP